MSSYVTAEPGDTIPRLADANGFSDYHAIWDRPENAELRELRQNPNVLLAGDVIFVPDKTMGTVGAKTERTNKFVRQRAKLELRLRLRDSFGEAYADTDVQLAVDGRMDTLTTDGDGLVSVFIPPAAKSAELTVAGTTYALQIGNLDPLDEQSGLRGRLRNLGYLLEDEDEVTDDDVRFGIALFQKFAGLTVDGNASDELLAALGDAHGS